MSSFSRNVFILLLVCAGLISCGFQPALQQNTPGGTVISDGFEIKVSGKRQAFLLEERLLQRLSRPDGAPRYQLQVSLTTNTANAAVPGAGGVDRKALHGMAQYEVRLAGETTVLAQGRVKGVAEYSANREALATLSAERDAEVRLMTQLSERIFSQLVLTASEWSL